MFYDSGNEGKIKPETDISQSNLCSHCKKALHGL